MKILCKLFGHKMIPKLDQSQQTCLRCGYTVGKTYEEKGLEHPTDKAFRLLEEAKDGAA